MEPAERERSGQQVPERAQAQPATQEREPGAPAELASAIGNNAVQELAAAPAAQPSGPVATLAANAPMSVSQSALGEEQAAASPPGAEPAGGEQAPEAGGGAAPTASAEEAAPVDPLREGF